HIVLLNEASRFRGDLLRVIDNGGVIRMLLGELAENRGGDLVFVRQRFFVGVRKIFFVERQRRFVDGGLSLLQIGLCPFHDFFHWQIRRQREAQFLPVLLLAQTEVAIGARE